MRLKQASSSNLKKLVAFRGADFDVPLQTGLNGDSNSLLYIYNFECGGRELVACTLRQNGASPDSVLVYDTYTLRNGGSSTDTIYSGFHVVWANSTEIAIRCYRINAGHSSSNITPIFYFRMT
jgi:hypothetical protein